MLIFHNLFKMKWTKKYFVGVPFGLKMASSSLLGSYYKFFVTLQEFELLQSDILYVLTIMLSIQF